jgi:hypothetical protein
MEGNIITFLQQTCIHITKLQTFQPKHKRTNNSDKTAQHSTFKLFLFIKTPFHEHGTLELEH